MNVSWVKVTLEEARGFVKSYTVRYDSIELRRKRAVRLEVVESDNSYKVIGGLGLTESYSITVSASTSAGEGAESTPIIFQGTEVENSIACTITSICCEYVALPYSTFQLRIAGITDCYEWRVSSICMVKAERCTFSHL